MMVVAVAMLGSLTVLPALLSRLGDKVDKGRIPFVHRLRREGGENRFWSAILTPSLKHPVVTVVASTAILVALALPAVHMHTAQSGLDALPKSIKTVPALDRIQASFPGGATPALVAIKGDADSPAVKAAVAKLKTQALASKLMTGPIEVDVNADRTVTRVAIPFRGNGTDSTSMQALHELRDVVLPGTLGQVPGRDLRGHRRHRRLGRRERAAEEQGPARVRLRPHLRVPAAAGLVPLGRDRGQGDRAQPAVGRRRLRRARDPLPVGLGREPAELPLQRRHRPVAADLHVRDPVRPLDGLPRVHPEPDPRGVRPRPEAPRTPSRTGSRPPRASSRARQW